LGLLQERADSLGISNTAWLEAMKRAELTDLRFHDLRHTWASWHRQAGTSSLSPELAARFLVRQAFREARI
jgi:integrase